MSSIKLTADSGGGTFEIKAPSSSGNTRVLTLPDTGNATVLTTDSSVGKVLQVVQSYKTDTFSASITYNDETGDITGLTPSITPSNASNKILVMWDIFTGNSASSRIGLKLYKASSAVTASLGDADGSNSRVTAYCSTMANDRSWGISGKYLDTAGGTSAITYSLRLRIGNSASNTVYVNRQGTLYNSAGSMLAGSSLILMEVAS